LKRSREERDGGVAIAEDGEVEAKRVMLET